VSKEGLNSYGTGNRPGIVLLVTLVLLIVLSTLGYTLSSRIAARRHRDRYIIDYQSARYGCDSAVKYALATLQDINEPVLIARPNEPDFSDLFILSDEEYEELLAEWAAERNLSPLESISDDNDIRGSNDFTDINEFSKITDFNDVNELGGITDINEPNSLTIRGPYGPAWPFITEPVEFEIGPATVRIEIEDENAKYPIGWAMLDDEDVRREAVVSFETFCEWMDINEVQIDKLKDQLKQISEIKPFKLNLTSITKVERTPISTSTGLGTTTRTRRTRTTQVRTTRTRIPVSAQLADYAKLFHSSLIDTEVLARPTIISERRKESALKYMGRWGSRKVNINTAPRHVLEAAFTFGGDADEIAEEIIQQRRIKPFRNIEDLKKALFQYTPAIEKCEEYITTASTFFTIKVTAVSGVAKASAIIAITKNGKKIERVAVISG